MSFFGSLWKRQLVGLDIGVSGIKAVELSGKKNPRLVAYNRIALPWDAIGADGEVKRRDIVVEALRKLFSLGNFSSNRVAVGAFGKTIITKKISMPKMSEAELSHQLYWEAEQYIPFNIQEVNIDFAVLGPDLQSSSETPMMEVLLVAAKKDFIALLKGLLEEADLVPEIVDSQPFALGNVFEFNYGHRLSSQESGEAHVIIDFGAGSTKVSIVEGNRTTFTRELQQSGMGCTYLISERLKVGLEEAEHLKIFEAEDSRVDDVLRDFTSLLTEEVSRTVDFFLGQSRERGISGIYVCGGGSRIQRLPSMLADRLGVPVEPLNPIQNISGSGKKMNAAAIRELAYLGAIAIGLSLREAGDSK